MGFLTICTGEPGMSNLLISASWKNRITGRRQSCKSQRQLLINDFPCSLITSCFLFLCELVMFIPIKDFYVFMSWLLYHRVFTMSLVISLNLNANLSLINLCPTNKETNKHWYPLSGNNTQDQNQCSCLGRLQSPPSHLICSWSHSSFHYQQV
jgi:hypothetical protein